MKHAAILALLFTLCNAVACAQSLRDRLRDRGDGAAELEGADAGALAAVVPSGVTVTKDVAYGADPAQRLDVYVPAGAKDAPIVFMVHGGAWMMGDKGTGPIVTNKVARWAPKGYMFVSTNYRMSRSPSPLDQADDVGRAIAYVVAHARTWGGDPARILLMGHSAGAHLAALVAADPTFATTHGSATWLGLVSLDSGALDVVDTMSTKHYGFYDRVFGDDPEAWKAASPHHRLATAAKPMLLVCASGRADSVRQSKAFAAKAIALGGTARVLEVAMKHGAINTDLGLDTEYTAQVEAFMRTLDLP